MKLELLIVCLAWPSYRKWLPIWCTQMDLQ